MDIKKRGGKEKEEKEREGKNRLSTSRCFPQN